MGASDRLQLDAEVTEYAEILRESYRAKESTWRMYCERRRIAEHLPHDEDVAEFASLVERASSIYE